MGDPKVNNASRILEHRRSRPADPASRRRLLPQQSNLTHHLAPFFALVAEILRELGGRFADRIGAVAHYLFTHLGRCGRAGRRYLKREAFVCRVCTGLRYQTQSMDKTDRATRTPDMLPPIAIGAVSTGCADLLLTATATANRQTLVNAQSAGWSIWWAAGTRCRAQIGIARGEFSAITVRLTACRAGDIVADSQKRRLNFLFAIRRVEFVRERIRSSR